MLRRFFEYNRQPEGVNTFKATFHQEESIPGLAHRTTVHLTSEALK